MGSNAANSSHLQAFEWCNTSTRVGKGQLNDTMNLHNFIKKVAPDFTWTKNPRSPVDCVEKSQHVEKVISNLPSVQSH